MGGSREPNPRHQNHKDGKQQHGTNVGMEEKTNMNKVACIPVDHTGDSHLHHWKLHNKGDKIAVWCNWSPTDWQGFKHDLTAHYSHHLSSKGCKVAGAPVPYLGKRYCTSKGRETNGPNTDQWFATKERMGATRGGMRGRVKWCVITIQIWLNPYEENKIKV